MSGGRDVIDEPIEIKPGGSLPDLEVHSTDRRTDLSGGEDRPGIAVR
jgi:hypothetical protein